MPKVTRPARLRRMMLLALPALVGLGVAAPSDALAQDARSAKQLLEDFNHFVIIDQYELAEASAQALLDLGLTPEQFLAMVQDSATLEDRFLRVHGRALFVPQIEDDASALYALYDAGRKGRARNQDEITRNLELLGGDARQRDAARSRLLEAREYAVPQLLEAALESEDIAVRAEAAQLLVDLGRNAAVPLAQALPHLDAQDQEEVARILGATRHRVSVPALYELWSTTPVSSTREAARNAIRSLDGSFNENTSLAETFRTLGERYYNDRESGQLLAFPGEDFQLMWRWRQGIGLFPDAIRTPLFHEAETMRLAEHALRHDAGDERATALWLASNISRELDQEPGTENPAYPADRPDAGFYAAALGHETAQRVLSRALADRDIPIAREAIDALRSTAGSDALADGVDGQRPLLDALAYPDRRVRYDAALALAEADPRRDFPGAERVIPTLAGMITQAGERYALVLASDPVAQQDLRDALTDEGYTVLPPVA
ncbi:MAG: HEAT repeat domain-containing protein, partial [Planctomycetota bacterium]